MEALMLAEAAVEMENDGLTLGETGLGFAGVDLILEEVNLLMEFCSLI